MSDTAVIKLGLIFLLGITILFIGLLYYTKKPDKILYAQAASNICQHILLNKIDSNLKQYVVNSAYHISHNEVIVDLYYSYKLPNASGVGTQQDRHAKCKFDKHFLNATQIRLKQLFYQDMSSKYIYILVDTIINISKDNSLRFKIKKL